MDCRLNLNVSVFTTPSYKHTSPSTLGVLLGMASPIFPPPPTAENDIYSMSDQELSDAYQFVEEVRAQSHLDLLPTSDADNLLFLTRLALEIGEVSGCAGRKTGP